MKKNLFPYNNVRITFVTLSRSLAYTREWVIYISLYSVKIYYFYKEERVRESERRNSDENRKWARSRRPFNARRWQMAATHVRAQRTYIPARTARSRIRKKARHAFFLPAYYSAAVARRYLKSGISNTDVARCGGGCVSRDV